MENNLIICAYIKPSETMLQDVQPLVDWLYSDNNEDSFCFAGDEYENPMANCVLISNKEIGWVFPDPDSNKHFFIDIDAKLIETKKHELEEEFKKFGKIEEIQKIYPDFKLEIGFGLFSYLV